MAAQVESVHRARPLRLAGALLCACVIVIHVLDQGGVTAMADPLYKGCLYYGLEIGAAGAAGLLLIPGWAIAGWVCCLAVAAGPFIGYVLSRSVGLPDYLDDIGNWLEPLGVASLVVEALLFGCAVIALAAEHRAFTRGLPRR